MNSKWMIGLVGLIIGLVLAGGVALVLEDADDDDDDGGGAALACSDLDASVLGPLVIVTAPSAAARVEGQFTVSGCAATLEQDVQYRVTDRSGGVLAEGFTTANAPDIGIAGEFSTQVDIGSRREGMLSLEVFEEDASDGEGGAPPRHVVPLVGG